jgi:HK97 family phage prohead protease
MEFKSIAVADISIAERKVIGYAASFGTVDKVMDIIKPGAFKKTLKENKSIKVFYNHMMPIGRPDIMREDDKGLYTESVISKTAKGDEILELIKDKVINEMSIGYQPVDFAKDNKTGIRTLKELKLFEYGPVDFAANEAAVITGVKAFTDRLASGQPVDLKHLAAVRQELKALLDALDSATGEPVKATPDVGPSIDTRILKLSEEHTARLAEAFRTKH